MQTECTSEQFEFAGFGQRRVVAAFDGGALTSDAGALLLRHTDRAIGLIERVAACFVDHREQDQVGVQRRDPGRAADRRHRARWSLSSGGLRPTGGKT